MKKGKNKRTTKVVALSLDSIIVWMHEFTFKKNMNSNKTYYSFGAMGASFLLFKKTAIDIFDQ